MANTYTQIYIHVVFSVQGRQHLISNDHKEELYKYITGIVRNKQQKLIAIGGMSDHLHILVGMKPSTALSDLVRDIKNNSSAFVNEKRWINKKFRWQEGFGAFSYSHSQIEKVVGYIRDQEKHHARKSFGEEYVLMLKKFNVGYVDKYLFERNRAEEETSG
ncbi:MAG TPA: IS200/IS605 family transposase [Bacteroidota bacterium]|nr:IS200/IS605 family transposase [Bacteroidota bacterium]